MIWQCALEAQRANCTLDSIHSSVCSRVREGILSETLCPALGSSAQEEHGPVGATAEEGHEDDEGAGAPLP